MNMDKNNTSNDEIDLTKMVELPTLKSVPDKNHFASRAGFRSDTPGIVRWVISHSGGLVKNERDASYFLAAMALAAIIISLFLFFGGQGGDTLPPSPPGALPGYD